jgi:hypothetical protein
MTALAGWRLRRLAMRRLRLLRSGRDLPAPRPAPTLEGCPFKSLHPSCPCPPHGWRCVGFLHEGGT